MSNPKTQEYLEAEQAETTNRKENIIKDLSPEDKEKFKIVEEVVQKLTDNKINFHLYSLLPNSWYNNKEVVWQYNSLTALANFDNAGKISQESNKNIAKFCAGMLTCIFNDVTSFKLGKDAPFKDRWECFGEYLQECLKQYYGYLDENDSRVKIK